MLIRQATVHDIAKKRITKLHGHLVVVTRYYPRFLKRPLIDEYLPVLAPSQELLKDFKTAEKAVDDHDAGFVGIDYESRFSLEPEGLAELERLAEMSRTKPVYLVCHCTIGQYCHRELLLLMAEKFFQARIASVSHPYETFRRRLPELAPKP